MKTMNNNHVLSTIENLKDRPIHKYNKLGSITGQLSSAEIKSYWRKDGSCQMVFHMRVNGGRAISKMELYVKDEWEWADVNRLLQSGQPLEADYCQRFDQYIDRNGNSARRVFLFINGKDAIRPVAAA